LDAIVVSDPTGYITRVNKSFLKMLGYKEGELLGKHIVELQPTDEGTYASIDGTVIELTKEVIDSARSKIYDNLFKRGSISVWEFYLFHKDGKLVEVEENIVLLFDRDGEVTGAVAIVREITARKRVVEELKEAREYLGNIFKTSADGIMIADPQGYITMVNDAIEGMFGYARGELIGKHTADLGLKEAGNNPQGRELIEKIVREGSAAGIEQTWTKKDGTPIAIEMNIALLKDKKGTATGSVASIRDSSERRHAEQALRKSEMRYRELVENANSIILRMDLKGNVTFFNEFAQNFFGFTEDEIIGKNVIGTIVPARESTGRDLAFMVEDIGRNPEKYENNENENMCKNGKLVWIAWTNKMVLDEERNAKEILCIGNDITDHKHAENELQETKDFLDNIIESSLDSIVILDKSGYITRTNKAFLTLLGMREEEVIGKHLIECSPLEKGNYPSTTGEIIYIDDDFFASLKTAMATLLNEGMVINRRTLYLTKDKSVVPAEDSLGFLFDEHGERIGAVGVIRDITERKRVERVIEKRTHDLEERIKELGALYAISKLCQQQGIGREELFQGIVDTIPPSFQYPESTCARIVIEGQEFATAGFKESSWKLSVDVAIARERMGSVEVYFLGETPEGCEEPFLREERVLLDAVGRQVENVIQLRAAEETLIRYQNQLREMASQLSLAEESARRKFAAYLHDQIGQKLFAAKIKLGGLRTKIPYSNKQESFDETIALLEEVINDTRALTFEMSIPILYELGIEAALEWLVEKTNADGDIAVTFKGDKQEKSLEEEVSIVLFRAVQELLTNVRKHAHAQNVEIAVQGDGTQVLIRVKDDGVGFKPGNVNPTGEKRYGFGLLSLRERLTLLGGYITIESTPRHGSAITLMVPLNQNKL
jgi:PAS domain S-box-containing protein